MPRPGCFLLQSNDVSVAILADAVGSASFQFTPANNPGLVGISILGAVGVTRHLAVCGGAGSYVGGSATPGPELMLLRAASWCIVSLVVVALPSAGDPRAGRSA